MNPVNPEILSKFIANRMHHVNKKNLWIAIFSLLTIAPLAATADTAPAPAVAATPAVQHPFVALEQDGVKNDGAGLATYDFGAYSVGSGKPVQHEFVLRNTTAAPVVIDHTHVACGCTSLLLNTGSGAVTMPVTVPPGQQISIHVSVDPSYIVAGNIDKVAWLFVAGQADPAMTLHLLVDGVAQVSAYPVVLNFGHLHAGDAQSLSLQVQAVKSAYGGNVPDPVSSSPDVLVAHSASPDAFSPDGSIVTRNYDVSVSPHARLGVLDTTIELPNPDGTKLSVFVYGTVDGDLSCQPGSVAFGSVAQGTVAVFNVTLTGTSAQALVGLKVKCGSSDLTAKIVRASAAQTAASPTCVLEVTYTPKKAGQLQSDVAVTTASGQTLDLPAWAYVN
jgi:hypothetical protein